MIPPIVGGYQEHTIPCAGCHSLQGFSTMSQVTLEDVLSCPNLPSLPAVAAKLIELTGDPDVAMSEIAKTVQQDQALAGKVLKTVNSSYYGLPQRCGSIERAMGYLGLNTVKSLVLGFSLVEATSKSSHPGFDMVAHWRRTLMGATAARSIATHFRISDKDEVFTAALFQDMGMLANYIAIETPYIEAIDGVDHGKVSPIEDEEFGFSHAKVGEMLARKWSLPDDIADAIGFHHNPDKAKSGDIDMIRAVSLGAMVAEALSAKSAAGPMRRIDSQIHKWFPGQKIDIQELLNEVNESAKELASLFNTEIGDLKDVQSLMSQAQERGVEHQISMQRQTENLEKQAFTDGLTGIPNRKEFDKAIEREFSAYQESGAAFAVLFFDADKFKSVNDTHGHAVGDAVLIELAKRTTAVVGSEGIVCRYGGEEFGIVLPGYSVVNAGMLAESVRSEIADTPFDIRHCDDGPDELPITVSIGVSAVDGGPADRLKKPEQIVTEADAGVYAAKDAGRNNVQIWSPDVPSSSPAVGEAKVDSSPEKSPSSSASASSPAPAAVQASSSTQSSVDGDRKIILIEDDALAATLLMTLLNRKGEKKIQWLKSGHEACQFFDDAMNKGVKACDLVICDLDLPGCSGFDVFRSFKEHGLNTTIPFVILTANDSDITKAEAKRLGTAECIGKLDFTQNMGKWINVLTSHNSLNAA